MLYIITLAFIFIWMVVLIRKRKLSWHSILLTYVIAVLMVDIAEVLFNLILDFYKFPTNLLADPICDNQLGIIFGDTLILPFSAIIFVYYNRKGNPWVTTILFVIGFTALELIYLNLGYMRYNNWNTVLSAVFYLLGFRTIAYLAPRIVNYNPPVTYWFRLLAFTYTVNMWIGAVFGMPVLKWYQFKTELFDNFMVDDRFFDLYSGLALAILAALFVAVSPQRQKFLSFAVIGSIGLAFALYFYSRGWLIYHHWNHFFMMLRYYIPVVLMFLYDQWELSCKLKKDVKK